MASTQVKPFHGLEMTMSGDHTTCIRVYDFEVESIIGNMMFQFNMVLRKKLASKESAMVTDYELEMEKLFNAMLDKKELVEYKKVAMPEKPSHEVCYSTEDENQFGYAGAVLKNVIKVFGKNIELYFPDRPLPAYAIFENSYIIMFAPIMRNELWKFEKVKINTTKTFDNDDLW